MTTPSPPSARDLRAQRGPAEIDTLDGARAWASRWLFDHALPLWWRVGYDQQNGGFVERISKLGEPLPLPRRAFVQMRQIYAYGRAGELGWDGPWEEAVIRGADNLLDRYLRQDGLFRESVYPSGAICSEEAPNYVQGFALLGLASAYKVTGDVRYRLAAEQVIEALTDRRRHADIGFHEDDAHQLPLLSNPHMHLLEGMLAWCDLEQVAWLEPAAAIVRLARERLCVDGAIREYFTAEWRPADGERGRIIEPGHQFEWAWLLDRYGSLANQDVTPTAASLIDFGERFGVNRANGAAVNEILDDGAVRDPGARLWPQTERLKASLLATHGRYDRAMEAFSCLRRYLVDPEILGLWHDRYEPDGSFRDRAEPSLGSSFYHVVCAFGEILDQAPRRPAPEPAGAGAKSAS